jgi:DNA polymerase-3 subunit alpha
MNIIEMANRLEEKDMVHCHVHTEYSLLDGYNRCDAGAKRAAELGMKALAMTDHNHVGGAITFQKACKKHGIKPLLGLEAYWTRDTNILSQPKDVRDEWAIQQARDAGYDIDAAIYNIENPISEKTGKALKPKKITKTELNELIAPYQYNTKQYHIILIAINQKGWSNLVRIQSEAAAKCTFNGRFLCDDEMLAKYSEGLIMNTACIGNVVPRLINEGKYDEAEAQIDKWHAIFGERFFIEIQPLNIQEQWLSNLQMVQWAQEKNINLVATTDVHYTLKEDHEDHDTLLCIGTGRLKADENRMRYSNDFWIKSYDEMIETFQLQSDCMKEAYGDAFDEMQYATSVISALSNTNLIASMVGDIKLGSDKDLFPNLTIPFGLTPEGYLTMKCFQNLYKYKKKHQEINVRVYERRLNEELHVINSKGFAPYILTVEDYITWANNNGCPTGPGRGSGAGSLVLFLMNITKIIDPIKYNLLFFRFLTMDRTAPPDIDTDFEYYGRDSVIRYLEEKYGSACVSHIGTYIELGVKSGLKDIGRVLSIDYGVINTLNKKVDEWSDKPELYFKDLDALKESSRPYEKKAWEEFNQYETEYPELFRLARAFEGVPRNTSVHASGILITPMPVNELFPTRKADNGKSVTFYTGPQLEDLKAIKFDILGLKTLSVIKQTLEAIDEKLTFDDLYEMVDIEDPQLYEMIQQKKTEGLFQIESNLFKGMFEEIIPTTENDIIVTNALGRPGPISAGMPKSYALRKNGHEVAVEPLRGTWEFVSDTYGTIAYQEQIMLIAQKVAGFDDNQSDSYLRKAFAKKKKDKMDMCRQWFIYGKLNEEAPEGYDVKNPNQPAYDVECNHGPAIPGGIANDYTEKELVAFWTNIEGFADYLFNKSHAACYAYICILTAFLKKYYPAKFMAALLSIQEDKVDIYTKVAREMGIEIRTPDINLSGEGFKAVGNSILYGLRTVKGVGANSVPAIVENRPYANLEEAMTKIPKKNFNKTVCKALIKAGAFDFENNNRHSMLNNFFEIKKDAAEERLNELAYTESACIDFEKEVLGTAITFLPWWDEVKIGTTIVVKMVMTKVTEKTDKNGRLMGFIDGTIDGCAVRAIAFTRQYCASMDKFDMSRHEEVYLKGKKDDKGAFMVSSVVEARDYKPQKEEKTTGLFDFGIDSRMESVI